MAVEDVIEVGTPVEVLDRFERTWCPGFIVAAVVPSGDSHHHYRLRRRSDGEVLPVDFVDREITVDRN